MKRLLGILLLLTLVLVGCGEADAPPVATLKKLGAEIELDPVATVEKLGAKVERNGQGEIVSVSFSGTQITDADLVHLKGLPNLGSLHLYNTQVTDVGRC